MIKVIFPKREPSVFDADGFFIINGTLNLYQEEEVNPIELGIDPILIELTPFRPSRTYTIAAFPKGEWSGVYTVENTFNEQ